MDDLSLDLMLEEMIQKGLISKVWNSERSTFEFLVTEKGKSCFLVSKKKGG